MQETNQESKIVVITEELLEQYSYLGETFKVGDETTEARLNELAQQYADNSAKDEGETAEEGSTQATDEETQA